MTYYIAVIHEQLDADYEICFPDFPGCITAGTSLMGARDMAIQALEGHVHVMREYGDPLPVPSTADDIALNPDFKDGVMMLVPVDTSA